jgi:hypothetical protein
MNKKEKFSIEKAVKPLSEGILKNNTEKPKPNIDKTAILKPPPAKPKE